MPALLENKSKQKPKEKTSVVVLPERITVTGVQEGTAYKLKGSSPLFYHHLLHEILPSKEKNVRLYVTDDEDTTRCSQHIKQRMPACHVKAKGSESVFTHTHETHTIKGRHEKIFSNTQNRICGAQHEREWHKHLKKTKCVLSKKCSACSPMNK